MDILGKEGEKAAEGINSIAERLDNLESHLNAVDNAIQDIGGKVQRIDQNSVTRQELSQILDNPGDEEEEVNLRELKDFFVQLSKNQKKNSRRLNDMEDLESDFVDTLKDLQKTMKKTHLRASNLEDKMGKVEKRVSKLESRLERHEEKLEETEEIKKELEQVERETESQEEEKSFEERQQNVEDELKDLRSSIKQFADRVEE